MRLGGSRAFEYVQAQWHRSMLGPQDGLGPRSCREPARSNSDGAALLLLLARLQATEAAVVLVENTSHLSSDSSDSSKDEIRSPLSQGLDPSGDVLAILFGEIGKIA